MRSLILIAHISLDGFVAGTKGELDGFDAREENLQFVSGLTEGADTALFGRISYQMMDSFWPTARDRPNATKGEIEYSNWYNKARKIVISRNLSGKNFPGTAIISENILAEISKLKEQAGKNIIIFGSPSISQLLMEADLIDHYWIFVNPVIFGEGIALFASSTKKIKLRILDTRQFPNGELAIKYDVGRH
jgi:dihydrofolate reductase